MSQLLDFFIRAEFPQEQCAILLVKAFTPSNFRRYKLEVFPTLKNIYFRLPDIEGVFSINGSCKMIPKYSTPNGGWSIQKLLIYSEGAEMALESEDKDQLATIYTKLKLIISHKGFNDYFKPIKRLGKGAFATVYLIEHRFTKQRWAAKVFSREGQKLEFKGQEALQNEIRTLRFLSHPNVIQYEGVYETENLIYLVTQYLSGGTLDEFMRNKSTLKGETIMSIITQVLGALKYLEINNVMHRDIKPENILMRQTDSKWVLADFGLSAFVNGNHIYEKCGTMGYMAPEILSQNIEERQLSKGFYSACDLYSFGIIAYNLIFGVLPFKVEAENMFDRKIVWDGWKRAECEEVHPDVVTFLKGLLESNPVKRLTPTKALCSRFLTDKKVLGTWLTFHQKRMDERFEKILKMANIN